MEERRNEVEARRVAVREDLARAEKDLAATRAEAAEGRATVERLERRNADLLRLIADLESQRDALLEVVEETERIAAQSRAALDVIERKVRAKREALDSIQDERATPNAQSPAVETKPSPPRSDGGGADAPAAGVPPTGNGFSD